MVRFSWSCLVLAAFLVTGCSTIGILQDRDAPQQSGLSTPAPPDYARQQGIIDADAQRRAALQAQQQQRAQYPAPAINPVPQRPVAEAIKVAVLVPLSGKSAPLGQAMVNAAQLAVFDMGINGFELMPRDSKGTTEGVKQATQDALASGAQLLIGPLFAADVAAVKPIVRVAGVSMLSLSTDASLAEAGAYVMGFAPAPQVERVVAYAVSRHIKNFAALVPAGPYGQLVSRAFEKKVKELGGILIASEPVNNAAALAAKKDSIEAIFVPLGGAELKKAVAALAAGGFEAGRVRLLGTGLWDEAGLADEQPLLAGGWFATAEPEARDRFVASYKETYGQTPPRLATLAYDATALAVVLARNGMKYDQSSLTVTAGFAGLDGIFRLTENGQIERGLAVLELGAKQNLTLDPSPSVFSGR